MIFISPWQLSLLANSDHWYLDGTFFSVPSDFYQLINISIYDTLSGMYIPLLWTLATHKSYDMYMHIFWDIAKLLPISKRLRITCDFESKLMEALTKIFDCQICGCLYHFSECLNKKSRKLGLTCSKNEDETNELIKKLKDLCFGNLDLHKELSVLKTVYDKKRTFLARKLIMIVSHKNELSQIF